MKKLICLFCWILCSCVASAQDFGVYEYAHSNNHDPLVKLYHNVTRYIAQHQKLPWVRTVLYQVRRAHPDRIVGLKFDYILPKQMPALSARDIHQIRLWKQHVDHNAVLQQFGIKILRTQDLHALSGTQQILLQRFFLNGTTVGSAKSSYLPTQVEAFKHYMVRLTFQTNAQEKPFYMIVNCYTRELFISLTPTLPGIPLETL